MDFDLYDDLLVGEEESPPTEKEKQLMEENEALKVFTIVCQTFFFFISDLVITYCRAKNACLHFTTSVVSVDFNVDKVWTDNDVNDGIKLMDNY